MRFHRRDTYQVDKCRFLLLNRRAFLNAEHAMALRLVTVKVDPAAKIQADKILCELGISFSEFARMAIGHLIDRGELPFDRIDSGVRVGRSQIAQSAAD